MKLPPLPDIPPRVSNDSNITASLSDGVLVSYSAAPPQREVSSKAKVDEILSNLSKGFLESVSQQVVSAPPRSPKGKKGKRDDEQKQQSEEQTRKEALEETKRMDERCSEIERILKARESTKNVYVSTPNGIRLSFKHGVIVHDHEQYENNTNTFLVKQEHVANEKEEITLENCDRVTERYRCITSDGLVLKVNTSSIIVVLRVVGR